MGTLKNRFTAWQDFKGFQKPGGFIIRMRRQAFIFLIDC
jgi:hypothetical protein